MSQPGWAGAQCADGMSQTQREAAGAHVCGTQPREGPLQPRVGGWPSGWGGHTETLARRGRAALSGMNSPGTRPVLGAARPEDACDGPARGTVLEGLSLRPGSYGGPALPFRAAPRPRPAASPAVIST